MGHYRSPSYRPANIDYHAVGVGLYIVCLGLWRAACWLFKKGALAARVNEPSLTLAPPVEASFEAWTAEQATHEYLAADDVLDAEEDDEEPEPELLMRSEEAPLGIDPDPEPRRYDIVREANGTVVLRYRDTDGTASELRTGETVLRDPPEPVRLQEGSRYRRKLIPPGSFTPRA